MHDATRYDPFRPTVGYNYHFTDSWYVRVDPRMAGPSWYRGHRIAGVHSGDRRLILADRDSREVWNPVEIPGAEWCPGEVVTTHTCCYNGITTAWQVIAAGDHPYFFDTGLVTQSQARPDGPMTTSAKPSAPSS